MATIIGTGLESYIKRNARERALNRIAEAKKQAEEILAQAAQRVALIKSESEANALKAIEEHQRRLAAQAQLRARQIRIRHREEVIERVWEEVRARLMNISSPDERLAILKNLLEDAAAQLQSSALEVQVNAQDQALLTADVLAEIRARLGEKYGLQELRLSSQPADIWGGVLVRSLETPELVDNSLNERLALAKKMLRDTVYHLLTSAGEAVPAGGEEATGAQAADRGAE